MDAIFYALILVLLIGMFYLIYNDEAEKHIKEYKDISGYDFDDVANDVLYDNLTREPTDNISDNITSHYIIGDILEHNVAPNLDDIDRQIVLGMAGEHYLHALDDIINNTDFANMVIAPETMVDHIEQLIPTVGNGAAPMARDTIRRNKAKTMTKQSYYNTTHISSDPQNVHESEVVDEIATKYNNIKQKNTNNVSQHDLMDIEQAIKQYKFTNKESADNALKAFHLMCKGNSISSLHDTEDNVVLGIWNRINSNDNSRRVNNLTSSFMDSLSSVYENGKPVCINGRCSRVIDSLTLLDTDDDISRPVKTAEILRQEILTSSYKIITDEVAAAPPDTRDKYNGKIPGDTAEFESHLKNKIESNIRESYAHVKPSILNGLIEDAKAGVE